MFLTRSSFSRRVIVTSVVAISLATAYGVSTYDIKRTEVTKPADPNAPPGPGDRVSISATAYCKGQTTAAGVAVQSGAAASDKSLLPLGSIIQVRTGDGRYDGLYTILDTGPEIQGAELDIYMWSCYEALQFGRRDVEATLVRKGWDPRAVAARPPSLLDRLFRRQPDVKAQGSQAARPPSRPDRPTRSAEADPSEVRSGENPQLETVEAQPGPNDSQSQASPSGIERSPIQ